MGRAVHGNATFSGYPPSPFLFDADRHTLRLLQGPTNASCGAGLRCKAIRSARGFNRSVLHRSECAQRVHYPAPSYLHTVIPCFESVLTHIVKHLTRSEKHSSVRTGTLGASTSRPRLRAHASCCVMASTVEERLLANASSVHAARWQRLIPNQLRPTTHPGVHQVLDHVMHLDTALDPPVWMTLSEARSVQQLRARYRQLAAQHAALPSRAGSPAPVPSSVAPKVDALLHFLQNQAARIPEEPVLLNTLHQRCQWMWVASTLHAAFTHPTLSELSRLRQGKPPRN